MSQWAQCPTGRAGAGVGGPLVDVTDTCRAPGKCPWGPDRSSFMSIWPCILVASGLLLRATGKWDRVLGGQGLWGDSGWSSGSCPPASRLSWSPHPATLTMRGSCLSPRGRLGFPRGLLCTSKVRDSFDRPRPLPDPPVSPASPSSHPDPGLTSAGRWGGRDKVGIACCPLGDRREGRPLCSLESP
jgi:hypothetical protein